MCLSTSLFVLSSLLLLVPHEILGALAEWLSIMEMPLSFRLLLAGVVALNSLVTLCFEQFVVIGWAVQRTEIKDRPSDVCEYIGNQDMMLRNNENTVWFEHLRNDEDVDLKFKDQID